MGNSINRDSIAKSHTLKPVKLDVYFSATVESISIQRVQNSRYDGRSESSPGCVQQREDDSLAICSRLLLTEQRPEEFTHVVCTFPVHQSGQHLVVFRRQDNAIHLLVSLLDAAANSPSIPVLRAHS